MALAPGFVLADPVTPERLLNAGSAEEAGNWLMVHRTHDANRYPPLDQITAANVGDLQLAFAVPLGELEPAGFGVGGVQTTPLVNDGFMYLTEGHALQDRREFRDARTNRLDL